MASPSTVYERAPSLQSDWKDKFLVVGIDIGTTHSGYVWSFLSDYRTDKTKIQTKTWKGEGKLTTGKTPTCLLLKPDKTFYKFGYEAVKEYTKLVENDQHKKYYYFEKFKMTLYEEKKLSLKSKITDSEGVSFLAVDIFTEAIKCLRDDFLAVIQAKERKIPPSNIFYVLTTPAIWSEKAKDFMRRAGEKAGIAPDHLRIALEPECAGVYVQMLLESLQYTETQRPDVSLHITRSPGLTSEGVEFNPGMTYLVIDMGGGTIDITLYRISASGKLQELDSPTGGPWGSDSINERFKDFIIGLVGAKVFKKFRQECREDYIEWLSDLEHKKCSWDGESNVNLTVPGSLLAMHKEEYGEDFSKSLKQSPYSTDVTALFNKLKMRKEMFEKLFKNTVDNTIAHIKNILKNLSGRVDMFLLVGGFADCDLMRRKIEETFAEKVDAIIYPSAEAVLAILKGSVLYGRDPSIIDTRICRYTYGLDWNEEFDPEKHPIEKKETTDDGDYCKDFFFKLIQKGDSVTSSSSSQIIEAYPRYKDQEKIEFPFYRSETKVSPQFVDEEGCFHLGTLSVELPPEDRTLNSCIKLKVRFGLTELTAEAVDSGDRKCSSRFNLWQN